MKGAFRKLVGITKRFVRFVEEVDLGIAVGRGYAPVGKNTRRGRRARAARGRVRAHRAGRRGSSGRA